MRIQFKKIICTTDLSDFSNRSIPYGIALAKEYGSKLYICHVIDLPPVALYGEAHFDLIAQQQRLVDYAHDQLDEYMADLLIPWEPIITVGRAADKIKDIVEEKHADLVIATAHGRSGLKRLVLGSVTERLMRILPCPLLAVRGEVHDQTPFSEQGFRLKRILVGCDFSKDSTLAFDYALSLAQEFETELYLAHVVETPVYHDLIARGIATEEHTDQSLRSHLRKKLDDMLPPEVVNWTTPKLSLLVGRPDEEIIKFAILNDIDLIVLGVHGRGLMEALLVGSTTDRVMRQAPCTVLSVRQYPESENQ